MWSGHQFAPWTLQDISHLDLNHGPLATFFEHLARENTAKSRAILVIADQVADALGLVPGESPRSPAPNSGNAPSGGNELAMGTKELGPPEKNGKNLFGVRWSTLLH
jgi:hypothetical protein